MFVNFVKKFKLKKYLKQHIFLLTQAIYYAIMFYIKEKYIFLTKKFRKEMIIMITNFNSLLKLHSLKSWYSYSLSMPYSCAQVNNEIKRL